MASPPICGETATSSIFSFLKLLSFVNATRRLAATHAYFLAILPSSHLTLDASAETASYYTASPPTNQIASHGAQANTENQLRRPRRHYIHKRGLTFIKQQHAKKITLNFFYWET